MANWQPDPGSPSSIRALYHWVWNQFNSLSVSLAGGGGADDIPLCPDIDPAQNDILEYIAADGELCNSQRMNYAFAGWVNGTTYPVQSTLRDEGWLMIANKVTTDKAAPQTSGPVFFPTEGATFAQSSNNSGSVIFGNEYTFAENVQVSAVIIDVQPANVGLSHTVIIIKNGVLIGSAASIPISPGIIAINISTLLITVGDVLLVEIDVVNTVGNNTVAWGEDLAWWATNTPTEMSLARGVVGGVFSNAAYSIDLQLQSVAASPDWDVLVPPVSGGGGGGGDGGGGGLVAIQTVENLAAGAFNFTAIPQTYSRLIIKGWVRSIFAAATDDLRMLENQDVNTTGYFSVWQYGNGNGQGGLNLAPDFLAWIPGATAGTNAAGVLNIVIEDYTSLLFEKVAQTDVGVAGTKTAADFYTGQSTMQGPHSDAITDLVLYSGSTADQLIGKLTLYGEI